MNKGRRRLCPEEQSGLRLDGVGTRLHVVADTSVSPYTLAEIEPNIDQKGFTEPRALVLVHTCENVLQRIFAAVS